MSLTQRGGRRCHCQGTCCCGVWHLMSLPTQPERQRPRWAANCPSSQSRSPFTHAHAPTHTHTRHSAHCHHLHFYITNSDGALHLEGTETLRLAIMANVLFIKSRSTCTVAQKISTLDAMQFHSVCRPTEVFKDQCEIEEL